MEIIRTTPSYIRVKLGERVAKLVGGSFMRGYGSPDFVIDTRALTFWESPYGLMPVTDAERASIIPFVLTTLRSRGWDIAAE